MKEICCENLCFQYEGRTDNALVDVNLHTKPGEFIVITGESGCGKTTLTRCINGQIPHFHKGDLSGKVLVGGKNISKTPSYEIAKWIGSVFQDPRSQFFTTNTTDEVAFGCENLAFASEAIQKKVKEAFLRLDIENLKNRSIFELSSGERQKIAIASAYAMNPQVFVLDEPSANLDMQAAKTLAVLLAQLKSEGHTIIVSEHRLYYLMALADRILYMENGRIAEEWTREQAFCLSKTEIERKGLRLFSIDQLVQPNPNIDTSSIPVCSLEAKDICVGVGGNSLIKGISFSAGLLGDRIIGITGENGVGKTTLVKLLCGLLKEKAGEVCIAGKALNRKSRTKETYFVMQDADYQLFTESVADELKFGNDRVTNMDAQIDDALSCLNILNYKESHPLSLSGGQKQRVTIAAAAVGGAKVLYFDEPTSGLDGKNMREVVAVLKKLSREGRLVFVISHDIEFLTLACDRILHLHEGRIDQDFSLDIRGIEELKCLLLK